MPGLHVRLRILFIHTCIHMGNTQCQPAPLVTERQRALACATAPAQCIIKHRETPSGVMWYCRGKPFTRLDCYTAHVNTAYVSARVLWKTREMSETALCRPLLALRPQSSSRRQGNESALPWAWRHTARHRCVVNPNPNGVMCLPFVIVLFIRTPLKHNDPRKHKRAPADLKEPGLVSVVLSTFIIFCYYTLIKYFRENKLQRSLACADCFGCQADIFRMFRLSCFLTAVEYNKRPWPWCSRVLCLIPACLCWVVCIFTSVVHVEAAAQVGEHSSGFPAQILEAAGNVLIYREPSNLFHRLISPQQVGLHRHRHVASVIGNRTNSRQKTHFTHSETKSETLWRSFKSSQSALCLLPGVTSLFSKRVTGPHTKSRPADQLEAEGWLCSFYRWNFPMSHLTNQV